jgi:hypothetical protein
MTDIANARDARLPIAQPASSNDCEAADGIGLRVVSCERGTLTKPGPRRAGIAEDAAAIDVGARQIWGKWTIPPHSEVSHLNSAVVSAPLGLWAAGRGDLWADPLEIRSEWYSSTAPIAANYLTSRRPATT